MEHQHRNRLDKLYALALQGVGGEQENAERSFTALLAKYGYTREEYEQLDQDVRRVAHFQYTDVESHDLLFSVIKVVTNGREVYQGGQPQSLAAEVTPRECADILTLDDLYQAEWKKAKSEFFSAFTLKHDLVHRTEITDGTNRELSREEYRRSARIHQLQQGLEAVARVRRIGTRPGGTMYNSEGEFHGR